MQQPQTIKCRSLLCFALFIFAVAGHAEPAVDGEASKKMKKEALTSSIQQHLEKRENTEDAKSRKELSQTERVSSEKHVRLVRSRALSPQKSEVLCLVAVSKKQYLPMRFKAKIRKNGEIEIEEDAQYSQAPPTREEVREKSAKQIARSQLQEKIKYWSGLKGDALNEAAKKYKQWLDDQVAACIFSEQEGLPLIAGFGNRARWKTVRDTVASKSSEELKSFLIEAGQKDLARLGGDD